MNSCHENRDISFENKDMSKLKHGEVIQDEGINMKAVFFDSLSGWGHFFRPTKEGLR